MLTLAAFFGDDMRRHARCVCATSAGNAGRRCSSRGKIPGAPELALVKLAEGFHDPVGVITANDIFVVERAAASEWSKKDGKVMSEPFIDLTNFNPLGSDVQTGFVEQGSGQSPSIPSSRTMAASTFIAHRFLSTVPRSSRE